MCMLGSERQPEEQKGCFKGCFYYTDSCFREDCKHETKLEEWRRITTRGEVQSNGSRGLGMSSGEGW